MKYLILISHNEQARDAWQGMSDTERQLGVKAHTALVEELAATGELIVSEALADPATARRVRVDRGRTIATDGPFAEVKEHLAGFYLVECDSIDAGGRDRRPGAGGAVRPGRGAPGARRRPAGRVTVTADVEDLLREHGAAGARRAGPPARRLRHLRGRRPGGAAGGGRCSGRPTGVPANPPGLADHGRVPAADRAVAQRRRPPAPGATRWPPLTGPEPGPVAAVDDTLTLLMLCCHPALTRVSQVALTLRAVGGLTTAEIARAFLVPEATVAQRISRAKQRIRASGAEFRLPAPERAAEPAGRRAAGALPDLQRGLHRQLGAGAAPGRAERARRSG